MCKWLGVGLATMVVAACALVMGCGSDWLPFDSESDLLMERMASQPRWGNGRTGIGSIRWEFSADGHAVRGETVDKAEGSYKRVTWKGSYTVGRDRAEDGSLDVVCHFVEKTTQWDGAGTLPPSIPRSETEVIDELLTVQIARSEQYARPSSAGLVIDGVGFSPLGPAR